MERAALEEPRDGVPPQQRRPQARRGRGGSAATPSSGQCRGGAGGDGGSAWGSASGGRCPGRAAAGSRGRSGGSHALYFSSSSDDEFEMFLARMKTPKSVSKRADASLQDLTDDLDDFLHFKVKKSTPKNAQKDLQTLKKLVTSGKKNTCCQELQYPEASSDSEDSVFVENSWQDYQKGGVKDLKESWRCIKHTPPQNLKESISRGSPDLLSRRKEKCCEESTENEVPAVALQQGTGLESDSSDDEFESLIERIRKRSTPRKPILSTCKTVYQPSTIENIKPPCEDAQPLRGEGVKTPRPNTTSLQETPSSVMASARIPRNDLVSCSQSAKTDKRLRLCSVPGCFLEDLSNPASHYVKYFKKNKEELAQKLYSLYNSTIFEQKVEGSISEDHCLDLYIFCDTEDPLLLPDKMVINWNKKMRKTAGYCVTGQTHGPEGKRYARIELSEKVCDSADRLRDTLVHEACHAATWLINGVRDGHGQFWRFYANKSAVIHPELPVVTRCHSYEINYKFIYECVLCKATIGRHSKSLDTERFVCAFCGGQLLLSQPTRKDGTPAKTRLTPFAKYVKENYGLTKGEQHGMSHAEVMRKLSADFALKTRLQDSL